MPTDASILALRGGALAALIRRRPRLSFGLALFSLLAGSGAVVYFLRAADISGLDRAFMLVVSAAFLGKGLWMAWLLRR